MNQALAEDFQQRQIKKSLIVKTIDGKIFDLNNYQNKVVIIIFWANWCSVCKDTIVDLNNLYQKYNPKGLEIIGLNIDDESKNSQHLVYFLAKNSDVKFSDFNDPSNLPTIYIVDKSGFVYEKLSDVSKIKIENIEKIIQLLLSKANKSN